MATGVMGMGVVVALLLVSCVELSKGEIIFNFHHTFVSFWCPPKHIVHIVKCAIIILFMMYESNKYEASPSCNVSRKIQHTISYNDNEVLTERS